MTADGAERFRETVRVGRPMRRPISGVCRYCRCTDENACEGGCSWVPGTDDTVCSSCEDEHNAFLVRQFRRSPDTVIVTFSRDELAAIRRAARKARLKPEEFVIAAARRSVGLADPRRTLGTRDARPRKGRHRVRR